MHRTASADLVETFALALIEITAQDHRLREHVDPVDALVIDGDLHTLEGPLLPIGVHADRHRGACAERRAEQTVRTGAAVVPAERLRLVGDQTMTCDQNVVGESARTRLGDHGSHRHPRKVPAGHSGRQGGAGRQTAILTRVSDQGERRPTAINPLIDVLHRESTAGVLLVISAVIALVWANSPWSDSYRSLWEATIGIDLSRWGLELTVREWINDLAMVLFFFVAGLEIKREVTHGELRDPRQAALPILAALGGMVVPAGIYAVLNSGGDGSHGWGVPMATDIAIVMGVIALIGTRVPAWLRLFLLALAIVDDIGAIIVIAVFYSEGVSGPWLALAAVSLTVALAIRSRVPWVGAYLALGAVCWISLHEAHIHPTLAGVAFGLASPVVPRGDRSLVDVAEVPSALNAETVSEVTRRARESVSVVEWLQHRLHPWSTFLVVPVFALANAGVEISSDLVDDALSSTVTWGVVAGLVLGKTIGITLATLLAVVTGIGRLPRGVTWRYVIGAGALGGIGFTVSLFVTELAFGESILGEDARIGVLVASLLAGIIGTLIVWPGTVGDSVDDIVAASHASESTT